MARTHNEQDIWKQTLEKLAEDSFKVKMRNMVFVVGVLACWFNSAMVANASIDKKVLTYRTFCSLHRLRTMSRNSEKSYSQVRFPGRHQNNPPFLPSDLYLGIDPVRRIRSQTVKEVWGGVFKSLQSFIRPAYLAYYDEANRKDCNDTVKTGLLTLSRVVNETVVSADRLYRKMFLSPAPRLNSTADRESLKQKVADYITFYNPDEKASINELRTFGTINELRNMLHSLRNTRSLMKGFEYAESNCP